MLLGLLPWTVSCHGYRFLLYKSIKKKLPSDPSDWGLGVSQMFGASPKRNTRGLLQGG